MAQPVFRSIIWMDLKATGAERVKVGVGEEVWVELAVRVEVGAQAPECSAGTLG
jgi:hypothetical protein